MAPVTISEYDATCPEQFRALQATLRKQLAGATDEVEHIGSTSVPGPAAKDRIDIQVGVAAEEAA